MTALAIVGLIVAGWVVASVLLTVAWSITAIVRKTKGGKAR